MGVQCSVHKQQEPHLSESKIMKMFPMEPVCAEEVVVVSLKESLAVFRRYSFSTLETRAENSRSCLPGFQEAAGLFANAVCSVEWEQRSGSRQRYGCQNR